VAVGLFRDRVAADNHLFTGGKSAIDLIGVRDSTLFLFELKKEGNAKAGILSELLFYASVIRDALGMAPRFGWEDRPSPQNCVIGPADLRACDRIEAVMLAPRFHPIVTPTTINFLNKAVAARWVDHPIRFSAVEFKIDAEDFKFGGARRPSKLQG
jgi:hypothetical protein